MSTPAGAPSARFRALRPWAMTSRCSNTDEQMAAANGDFDELWTRYVIPAGTYPGVDEA